MLQIFAFFAIFMGANQMATVATPTPELNDQKFQKSGAVGYEILEHRLEQLQHSNDQLADQLSQVSNTSKEMLDEQFSIMTQILKGIEGTLGNSKKIYDVLTEKLPVHSCKSAKISGVYTLVIDTSPVPYEVLCEMSSFGGGWIVIQQRLDGSVDFNRSWAEYRDGFGTVGSSTEFWLGLEAIHLLTNQSVSYELLVELKNEQGKYGYRRYHPFKVAGEDDGFRLSAMFSFRGTIKENLNICREEKFSTFDRDSDKLESFNCASKYSGGWWFYHCDRVSLNGPFVKDDNTERGIFWANWTDAGTYSRMMIRPF